MSYLRRLSSATRTLPRPEINEMTSRPSAELCDGDDYRTYL
jgi:hypothetical protein